MRGETVVFVGRKPISTYISRAVSELSSSDAVKVVARGQFVAKAVSVAVRLVKVAGCDYNVAIDEETLGVGSDARVVPKIEIKLIKR